MKVKIFPLTSSLHNYEAVKSETEEFLSDIKKISSCEFEIIQDAKEFYEDCDLSLILVRTGGSEGIFLKNIENLHEPYYLLTYGFSNSLAASLEILTYLNLNNLKGEVIHGSNEYVGNRIKELIKEKK